MISCQKYSCYFLQHNILINNSVSECLGRFQWEVQQRSIVGTRYNQLIDEAGISRVQQRHDRKSIFGQYTIFTENRNETQLALKRSGIPTAIHYHVPLNEQPAYKKFYKKDTTPVAQRVAHQVLSLPMGPDLTENELIHITSILSKLE